LTNNKGRVRLSADHGANRKKRFLPEFCDWTSINESEIREEADESASASESKGSRMSVGHEKLDFCQLRSYVVYEDYETYRTNQIDPDTDPDPERRP
jgi:hypothetical protein